MNVLSRMLGREIEPDVAPVDPWKSASKSITLEGLETLRIEQNDIVVVRFPIKGDENELNDRIHMIGNNLERYLGWRPLVIAIPMEWSMGAADRREIREFMTKVLAVIDNQK